MKNSAEKNIQFPLETIDFDEDIEMTDELFRNDDVEKDCVLSEEKISSFNLLLSPSSLIFPNLILALNLEHPSFHFLSY